MSGCTPDNLGLFLLVSLGAENSGLRAAEELPSGLCDQKKSSATTPQGRPSHEVGKQEEAFRSPSSPEEDPPRMNIVEKGYEPDCKTYVSIVILREKAGYIYQSALVHLQLA